MQGMNTQDLIVVVVTKSGEQEPILRAVGQLRFAWTTSVLGHVPESSADGPGHASWNSTQKQTHQAPTVIPKPTLRALCCAHPLGRSERQLLSAHIAA